MHIHILRRKKHISRARGARSSAGRRRRRPARLVLARALVSHLISELVKLRVRRSVLAIVSLFDERHRVLQASPPCARACHCSAKTSLTAMPASERTRRHGRGRGEWICRRCRGDRRGWHRAGVRDDLLQSFSDTICWNWCSVTAFGGHRLRPEGFCRLRIRVKQLWR